MQKGEYSFLFAFYVDKQNIEYYLFHRVLFILSV